MPRREDPNKETIDRLSKKTNLNIVKSMASYEKQLEKIDVEIESLSKRQLEGFDEKTELYSKYLNIGKTDYTIDRLREKLRKI